MSKSMVVGTTDIDYKDVPIISTYSSRNAEYPYITVSPNSVVTLHIDADFQKCFDLSGFGVPVKRHIGKKVNVSTKRKLITRYEKKEVTNV